MDVALKEWTKMCEKMGVKLKNLKYLFHLFFVNDPVIIAQDEYCIQYMIRKFLDTYRKGGLNNNFGKTEYLTSDFKEYIIIEYKMIKNVSHFKYVGSELQEQGKTQTEIKCSNNNESNISMKLCVMEK